MIRPLLFIFRLLPVLLGSFPAVAWACLLDGSSRVRITQTPILLVMSVLAAEFLLLGFAYAGRRVALKAWPSAISKFHDGLYAIAVAGAILLAAGLGLFGSIALPLYERTFVEVGLDVSIPVFLLFHASHSLWIGLAATLYVAWVLLRTKSVSRMAFAGVANIGVFILVWGILSSAVFGLC